MKSTVKVEMLDIYNHIDKPAAIIVVDGKPGFEEVLHVFLTNESLSTWLKSKREAYPDKDFKYVEDTLGAAVSFAIWNDVEGMSLYSSMETSLDVTKADLSMLTDVVDSYMTMSRLNKGRISIAEASERLKTKEVFFAGTMPEDGEKMSTKNVVRGATFIKRSSNGETFESLAVYLTAESAAQASPDKVPVSTCKLSQLVQLWDGMHPVIIEPKRTFCVEFSPISLI
jgi:hypothetical protein